MKRPEGRAPSVTNNFEMPLAISETAQCQISAEFACLWLPVSPKLFVIHTSFFNLDTSAFSDLAGTFSSEQANAYQDIVLPLHPGTGHHGATQPDGLCAGVTVLRRGDRAGHVIDEPLA